MFSSVKPKAGDLTQLRLDSCGEILKDAGSVRIERKVIKNQTLNKIERYAEDATVFHNGVPLNRSWKSAFLWGVVSVLTLTIVPRIYYGIKVKYFTDKVDGKNLDFIRDPKQKDLVNKCAKDEIDKVVNAWKTRENQHKPLPTSLVNYVKTNLSGFLKNVTYSSVDEKIKLLKTHLTAFDTNPLQDVMGQGITIKNIEKEMKVYREARKVLVDEGYLKVE